METFFDLQNTLMITKKQKQINTHADNLRLGFGHSVCCSADVKSLHQHMCEAGDNSLA